MDPSQVKAPCQNYCGIDRFAARFPTSVTGRRRAPYYCIHIHSWAESSQKCKCARQAFRMNISGTIFHNCLVDGTFFLGFYAWWGEFEIVAGTNSWRLSVDCMCQTVSTGRVSCRSYDVWIRFAAVLHVSSITSICFSAAPTQTCRYGKAVFTYKTNH